MNMVFRPAIERHPQLHEAHLAELLDDLEREAVGLVDFGSDWGHVPCDHLSDVVAERDLLLREAHER